MTLSLNNYNINLIGKEQENTLDGKADTDLSNLTNEGQIKAAHLAMPSDTYVDLTPDYTDYTMIVDGYFLVSRRASANGQYLAINVKSDNNILKQRVGNCYISNGIICGYTVAVSKGDIVSVSGTLQGSDFLVRFVYAQGAVSEAE